MDFFINYYVSFLIEHNISLIQGFFIWHTAVFVLIFILMFISVSLFIFIKNILFSTEKKAQEDISTNLFENNVILNIFNENRKNFQTVFSITALFSSIIFMWLLLPFSTSVFPIKTDVGVPLFIVSALLPLVFYLLLLYSSENINLIQEKIKQFFVYLCSFIPVIISLLSVVIIAGTLSFRDIVLVQNSHGILSWFCFPSLIGVSIIILLLALLFPDNDNYKNYQDRKTIIFNFIKYSYLFVIGTFLIIMFFGGYLPPVPFFVANYFEHSAFLYGLILSLEQIFWLILKIFILLLLIIYIKKYFLSNLDKNFKTAILFKYFIPLSIINFLIVCFWTVKFGGFYVI